MSRKTDPKHFSTLVLLSRHVLHAVVTFLRAEPDALVDTSIFQTPLPQGWQDDRNILLSRTASKARGRLTFSIVPMWQSTTFWSVVRRKTISGRPATPHLPFLGAAFPDSERPTAIKATP